MRKLAKPILVSISKFCANCMPVPYINLDFVGFLKARADQLMTANIAL